MSQAGAVTVRAVQRPGGAGEGGAAGGGRGVVSTNSEADVKNRFVRL